LNRLEETAPADTEVRQELLALKTADFLRSLGDGTEEMRCACENIDEVSWVEAEPLNTALLEQWLQEWKF
jgi:hypothetical protein